MNLKTRYEAVLSLLGALVLIAVILSFGVKYLAPPQIGLGIHPLIPQPPISLQPSLFPCLGFWASKKGDKRVVVLHGPDWTLESSVEPNCLPEREVVLSFVEGRHFLPSPVKRRVRFWLLSKGDKVYVKIVESSGSEESDNSALDLVTNHKCKTQTSKNCYVQSGRIVVLNM